MSGPENPLVFPQDTEQIVVDGDGIARRDHNGACVTVVRRHGGMTLRDAVALAVLPGVLSDWSAERAVERAFLIADLFLAARQQKEPAK